MLQMRPGQMLAGLGTRPSFINLVALASARRLDMVENRSPVISQHYTQKFYERLRGGARASAEVIAPLVLQLLPVRSLVDVGCGDGNWSAVFHELGVHEILGMDGEYVRKDDLQIPREWFQ